jgi:hypothetical protein
MEIVGPDLAEILRGVFGASVRSKADMDPDLATRICAVESGLVEQYRRRTEADVDAGLRYAVFPLCAVVLWE